MMVEVNFRPIREDDLKGGLGAGLNMPQSSFSLTIASGSYQQNEKSVRTVRGDRVYHSPDTQYDDNKPLQKACKVRSS